MKIKHLYLLIIKKLITIIVVSVGLILLGLASGVVSINTDCDSKIKIQTDSLTEFDFVNYELQSNNI